MTGSNRLSNNSRIAPNQNGGLSDLFSHPVYKKLVEDFQNGNFDDCEKRISELEEHCPGHPELKKYKENVAQKLSMKSVMRSIRKIETRDKIRGFLKFAFLIILTIIFITLIAFISYDYINSRFITELTQDEQIQLSILETQVEIYLNEGEPEAAALSLEQIRGLDPNYKNIPDLTSRVYKMLLLKEDYKQAQSLLTEGREGEALNLFLKIEEEHPGLWDVSEQILLLKSTSTP